MKQFSDQIVKVAMFIGVGSILYFIFPEELKKQSTKVFDGQIIQGTPTVIDGDTIEIDQARIRLAKIDTCEIGQTVNDKNNVQFDCGKWATDQLKLIVGNHSVICIVTRYDQYKRAIAQCSANGEDLGFAMLKSGSAEIWYSYKKNTYLEKAVEHAHSNQLGIYSFNDYVSPHQWRQKQQGL